MGVASMSFTCAMPSALIARICAGRAAPWMVASSAGTRLSSTMVVLPEPDTPVTTVSRPLGMSTSSGLTVWICAVDRWIVPFANSASFSAHVRCFASALPERNGPICDAGFSSMVGMVPSAITWPPFAPASGPISMIQSASLKICVSWSTRMTEFPSATRSCMTPVSPTRLEGCRPMDGSSSTYRTPVVRLRTARANCIRWRSPVESVDAARSSVR